MNQAELHLLFFIYIYPQIQAMRLMTIICFALTLWLLPFVQSLENNYTSDSLDAFLKDYALRALVRHRPRTGILYKGQVPANLSGMEVSIVRIRSRNLLDIGANFINFWIPPGTKTVPHVKRLAIVFQDLGNWSSHYYNVPGFSLITPVVGFMVFNASSSSPESKSIRKISLDTRGRPIGIKFPDSEILENNITTSSGSARCVAFGEKGKFELTKLEKSNICHSKTQGHFSIVVPLQGEKGGEQKKKKEKVWYLWMVGFVIGFGGLGLVGYFGILSLKVLKTKKIQVMERQADEDLVLQTLWVGNSKMPSATGTRTQPTIDHGDEEAHSDLNG